MIIGNDNMSTLRVVDYRGEETTEDPLSAFEKEHMITHYIPKPRPTLPRPTPEPNYQRYVKPTQG